MKLTATKYVNIRIGSPDTEAPCFEYLSPGTMVEILESVPGTRLDGNDKWYKGLGNSFYWSGGFDQSLTDTFALLQQDDPFTKIINYNTLFEGITNDLRMTGGQGVTVGVMDSGIFRDHADLKSTALRNLVDFVNAGGVPLDDSPISHGTHLAGLIAAQCAGNSGIKGIAPFAGLDVLKVAIEGFPVVDFVKSALQHLLDARDRPQIVNMSFALSAPDYNTIVPLLDQLTQKTICVAAAGNNKTLQKQNILFPSMHPNVISVGSVDKQFFEQNSTSKFNSRLDLIMPKLPLFSCARGSEKAYLKQDGSSMCAALTSGLIALILSKERKQLPVAQVKEQLKEMAIPYEQFRFNSFQLLKP